MAAILHLVSGKTLEVLDDPEDAARLLWGGDGDGARDSGYASLEGKRAVVRVNPKTVIYVEPAPQASTRFSA